MAIELAVIQNPAIPLTRLRGRETIVLEAAKTLTVETGPQGDELLDVEVPEGKQWEISISIDVIQTDT